MQNRITPEIFETETMDHLNDLYRTAVRLTRNQTDAEDLVQETFMQAWKSFENYEIGTNCRAWLYKILFNKYDHYRRKKFTQAKYIQEADDLTFLSAAYSEPVSEKLSDEEIIGALNKLPEHYRAVILLTDVQDFSYKEAAVILDLPIGTIMSRLNRGRNQLKKTLSKTAQEYGILPISNSNDFTRNAFA
ncbi:MAG TPA: sigma-70 family RNA polymerase sigma factor [Pyrinomonadaceae bacterium]|nr:sigma-70 family RNA polymerase sigma factor [Pyrinomonadaceae bacterium]